MTVHLTSNGRDRTLGALWEKRFCQLAVEHGKSLTPNQLPRGNGAASWYRVDSKRLSRFLLPDVVIWTAPGEHHEIKHKDATRHGCYGLEDYRLNALLLFAEETDRPVLYTIYDWRLAGAASADEEMPNRIEDWRTVDVRWLAEVRPGAVPMRTWLNGRPAEVPGYFWPVDNWTPLAELWQL